MPLIDNHSSLIHGAACVTRRGGHVRVAQTRVMGWWLVAFGLGLPGAMVLSEFGGIPPDLPARLLAAWSAAAGVARFGMVAFILFFGSLLLYGLFWLVWRRELDIDVNLGRWRFVSGLPLMRRRVTGHMDDAFVAELSRMLRRAGRAHADGTYMPQSGRLYESWELRLAIPGNAEPLFLGEWGIKDEALAEIGAWQAMLPRLRVEETGQDA